MLIEKGQVLCWKLWNRGILDIWGVDTLTGGREEIQTRCDASKTTSESQSQEETSRPLCETECWTDGLLF